MKLVFTEQAVQSLEECLEFLSRQNISSQKLLQIRNTILTKTSALIKNPHLGQPEEYLEHLSLSHRRIITGNYKIIYRIVASTIYITDIFDSRQDPSKMRG